MAKLTTDELLDAFKEMTLIELSEFVKQFEETFGVTAAAPVAVAAAPAAGGAAGAHDDAPQANPRRGDRPRKVPHGRHSSDAHPAPVGSVHSNSSSSGWRSSRS